MFSENRLSLIFLAFMLLRIVILNFLMTEMIS